MRLPNDSKTKDRHIIATSLTRLLFIVFSVVCCPMRLLVIVLSIACCIDDGIHPGPIQ